MYDLATNANEFWQILPQASNRVPFTKDRFNTEFLPILLLWYLLGILVQLPNTRRLRLAILPIMGAMAWRAHTTIMIHPQSRVIISYTVCCFLIFVMLRATDFAVSKRFKRVRWTILPEDALQEYNTQVLGAMWNALDLVWNARGIGWDWGKSTHVPPKVGGDSSPGSAISASGHLESFVKIFFDFVLFAQQSWTLYPSDSVPTHPAGGTIFDPTLSPLLRYGKVVIMTCLCPLGLCCSFQATYNAVATFSIAILRQKPEKWPPLFHAPWRAESLGEFWGTRWHQVWKRSFVTCSAKPGFKIAGRAGGVIGAFFVSGLMHDFGTWGAGMGTDFMTITLFFTMMGVGIVMEGLFAQSTKMKVRGPLGWAWARRGLIISKMSPDEYRPALYWATVVQKWISLHGEPFAQ